MRKRHTMRQRLPIILLAVFMSAAFAGPALTHSGAKGVVKERMELMKSIGLAMKTIGGMARGRVPLEGKKIVRAAAAIGHHGERITGLFPKGSGHGVSEASPEIWRDWDGFKNSADRMVAVARDLEKAGRANDAAAVKAAYRALGRTCGSCHKLFRIKKKKMQMKPGG